MTAAWLSGDASFAAPLAGKADDLRADIKAIDEVDRRLDGALDTSKRWAALSASCRELLDRNVRVSAAESFARHTKALEDTIALITAVGDTSKLTLDPDIDSYYLMNLLVFQGPELSELVAQARGRGTALIAAGTRTAEPLDALNRLSVLVGFMQKKVDESVGKALAANEALKPQLEAECARQRRRSGPGHRRRREAGPHRPRQPGRRRLLRRPHPQRQLNLRDGGRRDQAPERPAREAHRDVPARGAGDPRVGRARAPRRLRSSVSSSFATSRSPSDRSSRGPIASPRATWAEPRFSSRAGTRSACWRAPSRGWSAP